MQLQKGTLCLIALVSASGLGCDGNPAETEDGFVPGQGRCEGGQEALQYLSPEETADGPSGIEICPNVSAHRFEPVACVDGDRLELSDECDVVDGGCPDDELCYDTGDGPWCHLPCNSDGDCAAGEICLCAVGTLFTTANGSQVQNPYRKCVAAGCRDDTDCAPFRCGITQNGCGDIFQLECHTSDDDCEGRLDCPDGDCVWTGGQWRCKVLEVECD